MNYYYTISYDDARDDFYAVVDIIKNGKLVIMYTIDTTAEMRELIQTGVMKHIDDIAGLKSFLEAQEILGKDDSLTLIETTLY